MHPFLIRKMYHQLRTTQTLDPDVRAKPEIVEEIHRIDVDCRRTDRTQAMFAIPTTPGETDAAAEDDDGGKTASNGECSTGSILLCVTDHLLSFQT